jgi:hypothetical protein
MSDAALASSDVPPWLETKSSCSRRWEVVREAKASLFYRIGQYLYKASAVKSDRKVKRKPTVVGMFSRGR